MKERDTSSVSRLLLAACIPVHAKSFGEWRTHTFDQFCLVTDGDVGLELAHRKVELEAPTLTLIRRGEEHGYWKMPGQNPNFWVLYFQPGQSVYEALPVLNQTDPAKRIWRMSTNQVASFQDFFIRMVSERAAHPESGLGAETAWLNLLMVTVARWAEPKPWMAQDKPAYEPDLEVPAKTNGHARPADISMEALNFEMPTYESLRLLFGKTFGASPHKL